MNKAFEIAGYPRGACVEKFGGMNRAFQYGAPPHGGIAPGVDRIVMLLVRRAEHPRSDAFPMNQQARRPDDERAVRGQRRSSCASCTSG